MRQIHMTERPYVRGLGIAEGEWDWLNAGIQAGGFATESALELSGREDEAQIANRVRRAAGVAITGEDPEARLRQERDTALKGLAWGAGAFVLLVAISGLMKRKKKE